MVYPIAKYIIPPIYKLWVKNISGIENIPKKGPFIVAANHSSFYDDLLPHAIFIPKSNTYVCALVNSRFWKGPIVTYIFNWGKCIPVYVGKHHDKEKNRLAFERAMGYLKQGNIVHIFPEGARSADGNLKKAKYGVAKLAFMSGVPVLPMGITGSDKILPKGKTMPRFRRCKVKFGKPLIFKKIKNPSKKHLEELTRRIMKAIAKLIGQEYKY